MKPSPTISGYNTEKISMFSKKINPYSPISFVFLLHHIPSNHEILSLYKRVRMQYQAFLIIIFDAS